LKYAFPIAIRRGIFDPMLHFLIFIGLAYLLLMLNYVRGWLAYPLARASKLTATSVAVVVVARNEEQQIEVCLESIFSQNMPEHCRVEIILVDDHSTDRTCARALTCAHGRPFQLLQLADYQGLGQQDLAFKKRALEYALSKTQAEIIVTTDADCVAQPNWLAHLLSPFVEERVQIAGGPVLFQDFGGLLGNFQALDLCGTMGITAAGIGQGWQRMANGANLAFRRSAWEKVGGYTRNAHLASGDDMFLMQQIAATFPESVVFVKHREAVIRTKAQPDLRSFVAQRLRWGTKSAGYQEWKTQLALGIAWLMCMSICLTLIWAILTFSGYWLCVSFGLLLLKAVADFPLLASTTRFFGERGLLRWFWPSLVLHTVYVAGIGTASMLVKNYVWKGREVR
jgi:cellulose synthase/poly-beta-1,6-N-acetylglucosamine synthase-like glycosyltransferase